MKKRSNDLRFEADDVNYYFGEIKLWYDANKKHKQVGVVVESKSNEVLFRKLLHHTCRYFPVEGWRNVKNVIEQSNFHQIQFAIGIIDADFRRINGEDNELENLFLTDFHDTEIMCIYSDAWQNVLNFYIDITRFDNFKKITQSDFRDYLMQVAKPIGILRLLNERENLALKFKMRKKNHTYDFIDYQDFIDSKTLKIDIGKLLKTVENKSMKPNFFKQSPVLLEKYKELFAIDFDLNELNNGHDLLNILSVALQDTIANRKSSGNVSGATLEEDFIKVYRKEDFTNTQLYNNLKIWETNHIQYFVVN